MTKRYVTWESCNICDTHNRHPQTNDYWNQNQDWTFTETWYSNGTTYIWVLDSDIIPAVFEITEKTEAEVNTLLETWYWLDWESNPYVTVNNYIFTDNRPVEI